MRYGMHVPLLQGQVRVPYYSQALCQSALHELPENYTGGYSPEHPCQCCEPGSDRSALS